MPTSKPTAFPCSFCGAGPEDVRLIAVGPGGIGVCDVCAGHVVYMAVDAPSLVAEDFHKRAWLTLTNHARTSLEAGLAGAFDRVTSDAEEADAEEYRKLCQYGLDVLLPELIQVVTK